MSLSSFVNEDQLAAIRRAMYAGDYNLFLGAGASRDALSRSGDALPGAAALSNELAEHFEIPMDSGDTLPTIYDRALRKGGPGAMSRYLLDRFSGVRHPHWMENLARFPWRRIWTLNIDDSFESSLRAVALDDTRPWRSLSWLDEFQDNPGLDVVHLHGMLTPASEQQSIIFSLSEYATGASSRSAWPKLLNDTYGIKPFVIIGAQLVNEPDINPIVRNIRPRHAAPSFYVSRTISSSMRFDLESWGLIPVEMEAGKFSEEWSDITGLDLSTTPSRAIELGLRMGEQFRRPKFSTVVGRGATVDHHDFHGGDQPTPSDAAEGRIAHTTWVRNAITEARAVATSKTTHSSYLIAFLGSRWTGRSATLLEVGRTLQDLSWTVLEFKSEGRIDIDPILQYASTGISLALLFDGISEVVDDIDRLIDFARRAKLNLLVIGVDDRSQTSRIVSEITESFVYGNTMRSIPHRLGGADADALIETLREFGRLGSISRDKHPMQRRHFSGKSLFNAMAGLENAPGFRRRIRDFLDRERLSEYADILVIASLADFVGERITLLDLAALTGIGSSLLSQVIQENRAIGQLLSTDGEYVRCRQRNHLLPSVVDHFGAEFCSLVVRNSIIQAAPRLNNASARSRSRLSRLVAKFMRHRTLSQVFRRVDLNEWYESLRPIFGDWNGRYWEQRAIYARENAKRDPKLLGPAESWASRAVQMSTDSYSLTTLMTIYLTKASISEYSFDHYFDQACKAHEDAIRMSNRSKKSLVTDQAFLEYTIMILESFSERGSRGHEFRLASEEWEATFLRARLSISVSEDIERSLSAFADRYWRITGVQVAD
ncbi:SIR2 family protein [Micrococcus yunnanensis]|uniref:hypothetical protein n=1 Tax=Micrococcus yunnanensis TaxID=566027 RepID=UPI00178AD584|nr:hypothetical protein [Micrococcus yunnanensis]MBE1538983.1 hypothetical protein [Micrococcus yunnanensis]